MYPSPLTACGRAVFTALLAVDFDGVERLRAQAAGTPQWIRRLVLATPSTRAIGLDDTDQEWEVATGEATP